MTRGGHNDVQVRDFMRSFRKEPDSKGYLFDWGLPKSCTELLENFVVPSYFAGDYLQSFAAAHRHPATGVDQPPRLFADSWPSLFVGPAHSGGGLHIDSFGSNFWMAVLSGRKLWQVRRRLSVLSVHKPVPSAAEQ